MDEELIKEIRKISLLNSVEHNGKTNEKIVLSKILGTKPELRSRIKELLPEISSVVKNVNSIPADKQKIELDEKFPKGEHMLIGCNYLIPLKLSNKFTKFFTFFSSSN